MNLKRCTTSWKIGQAISFRAGSSKLLGTYGTNMQNPSQDIRRFYRPDAGKVFIQVDQAGADALIVSYLCPESSNFRALFKAGIKPHTYIAFHIYREFWESTLQRDLSTYIKSPISGLRSLPDWKLIDKTIKSDDKKYYIGKKTVHSSNYGQMEDTFILTILKESEATIRLTREEGKKFQGLYHGLFPEIKSHFHTHITKCADKDRILRSFQGYPIKFYGPRTDKMLREMYAWIPQATVACITHEAITDFHTYTLDNRLSDWDLLNNMHDSALVQVPIADAPRATKVLHEFMCRELTSPAGERFKMRAEAGVGMNWAKYNKETNPEGIKEVEIIS